MKVRNNMEDKTDKQRDFIELRAKGNSFDRIAKKIGVSKGTLIDWSKQLSIDLGNQISLEADATLEKYQISKIHQLELYGIQLNKIRMELEKRDLSDIATPKLVEMQLKLMEAVNNSGKSDIFFRAEGFVLDDLAYDWKVG
jgi:transposase